MKYHFQTEPVIFHAATAEVVINVVVSQQLSDT